MEDENFTWTDINGTWFEEGEVIASPLPE